MTENEKKLALAIFNFGRDIGGVLADGAVVESLTGPQLQLILDDAKDRIAELTEKVRKVGKIVDIFWERQGYYIVELDSGKLSEEYTTIDLAVKSAAAQGYLIREVRRTRGGVPQPKVPLPERRDAE